MTADLVQAIRPFVGRIAGRRILVRAGDLYRADDPVVKEFAGKFRAPVVLSTRPAPSVAVPAEQKIVSVKAAPRTSTTTTKAKTADKDG